MRLYFENPVGRVLEHPDGYALVQYTGGNRDFATFQAFLTHTGQLLRRQGWHKLVADHRAMQPFSDQERNWLQHHLLASNFGEGNTLYGAILVLPHLAAQLAQTQTSQIAALAYRVFDDEKVAASWLQHQP